MADAIQSRMQIIMAASRTNAAAMAVGDSILLTKEQEKATGEGFQVRPSSVLLSHVAPQCGQAVNAPIFCFLSASMSCSR
jgi:hypothetical protein